MDTAIFDVLLQDNVLVSTLTRVQGRGVNQGYKNIQRITATDPERTRHTLMHELGHALMVRWETSIEVMRGI